jgi:alpha-tubulin suppressor-like RCC1 family protein/uncharacterized protein YjdB/pimeloyl-ACP methyl ester carboxylesterase
VLADVFGETLRSIACLSVVVVLVSCGGGGGDSPTAPVQPTPPVAAASIAVTPDTASVIVGATTHLVATVLDTKGQSLANAAVTWSSSDATILAVDQSGNVQALKVGPAEIRAVYSGLTGRAKLWALYPTTASGVTASTDTLHLRVGSGSGIDVPPGLLPTGTGISATERTAPAGSLSPELLVQTPQEISVPLRIAVGGAAVPSTGRIALVAAHDGDADSLGYLFSPDSVSQTTDANGRSLLVVHATLQTVGSAPANSSASLIRRMLSALSASTSDTRVRLVNVPGSCPSPSTAVQLKRIPGNTGDHASSKIALILVHGWQPTLQLGWRLCEQVEAYNPAAGAWSDFISVGQSSLQDSYDIYTFRYPTFQHIDNSASDFLAALAAIPRATPIVIVAHSMGGLVAGRVMLATPSDRVSHLYSLGTPWLGSALANNHFRDANTAGKKCGGLLYPAGLLSLFPSSDGSDDLSPNSDFFSKSFTGGSLASLNARVTAYAGDIFGGSFFPIPRLKDLSGTLVCIERALEKSPSGGDGIVTTESATGAGVFSDTTKLDGFDHLDLTGITTGLAPTSIPIKRVISKLTSLVSSVIPVASVVVDHSGASISLGGALLLHSSPTDYLGRAVTGRTTQWTSSDATIASVDASGLVTAKKVGQATISASVDGISGSAVISVSATVPPTIALSASSLTFSATAGINPVDQTLQVTNSGGGTLSGLSNGTVAYGTGQPVGWLAASLNSSTAPATLTLKVTGANLSAGTYTASVSVQATATGVTNSPQTVSVKLVVSSGASFFSDIGAGNGHTCGLATGTAYCWGQDFSGELGDGANSNRNTPVAVGGGKTFTKITPGANHTCALVSDGSVYCWGSNNGGALGDGTFIDRALPTLVAGGNSFQVLSTSGFKSCGLTAGGAAYCWGNSDGYSLGDTLGTRTSNVPLLVSGGLSFKRISAGTDHTCAITVSGVAYCWGSNSDGQLGDGSVVNSTGPTLVSTSVAFDAISAGENFTCGLATSGLIYCWGANTYGALGDGTTVGHRTPVAIAGGKTFTMLAGGGLHACALATDGKAWCWGVNTSGELGDGSLTSSKTLVAVAGGLTFQQIVSSPGGNHTCGITTSDTYCWGLNGTGQLGDGTTANRNLPVQVKFP